jgi:hypothetical protein
MVFAQYAAFPGEGVFLQFPGRLQFAEAVQVVGKVGGGREGAGVIVAVNVLPLGESV